MPSCAPAAGRLAGTRAQRADADVDARLLLEHLLTDALLVHALPEWPAAQAALLRGVAALHSRAGLFSPDAAVRQVSVDLLGQVAAQLCYEERVAARDAPALAQVLADEGAHLVLALSACLYLSALAVPLLWPR